MITEALKWIETTLPEFGIAGIKVRDLISFLKAMLDNANPTVRKGALAVLVVLRIAIGPGTAWRSALIPALLGPRRCVSQLTRATAWQCMRGPSS